MKDWQARPETGQVSYTFMSIVKRVSDATIQNSEAGVPELKMTNIDCKH